jgi:hypothetical protein
MGPMKEDELLGALTAASREAGEIADPRWDRLAEGTLTPDEARELAAIAEQSEFGRTAQQAFTPLDEGFRERMTDALIADIQREAPAGEASAAAPGAAPAPSAAPAPVVALRPDARQPGISRTRLAWMGALAAAAALALFLGRGEAPGEDGALPQYGLTVIGGEKPTRSAPSPAEEGPLVLGPGSRLELVLRPATPVRGEVHAGTYLQRPGGAPVAWSPPVALSEGGAVRIAGTKEELFPTQEDGEWQMAIAVSRQPLAFPGIADCTACAVVTRRIRLHSSTQ